MQGNHFVNKRSGEMFEYWLKEKKNVDLYVISVCVSLRALTPEEDVKWIPKKCTSYLLAYLQILLKLIALPPGIKTSLN